MNTKQINIFAAVTATAMLVGILPLAAADTDDRIESSFKTSYVYKTYLKDDSVKIEAEDGVVELSGTVTDEGHKALAQETAAGLPGVVRVENKLKTKSEAATDSPDAWVAGKVKMALLFHRNVNASGTTVDVKDGVVTLTGEAENLAQKDLTTEYAADIDGVKSVNNAMTVPKTPGDTTQTIGEKIDDASINAQVKVALLTHRSSHALATKVEVQDGAVTLTGIAKNDAEKSLATKLVNDIKGVTSVDNKMTVAEVIQ